MEHNSTERSAQGIIVCVDVVLVSLVGGAPCVLLHRRPNEPFKDALALPGGYIRIQGDQVDSSAESAAKRVLQTKTGVMAPYLEQLGTYSGPDRDPGGWSVSIAYLAVAPTSMIEGTTLENAQWTPWGSLHGLAFDHAEIIADAVSRVRSKAAYSSLPAFFCPSSFSLTELQTVYEAILGANINKVSFRRRVAEMDAFEQTGEATAKKGPGSPARLWRLKDGVKINAILRGFGDN